MKLYDAVKMVIGTLGAEVIEKSLFVNALNDFQAFVEVPAARHVIHAMMAEGYCGKLYAIYAANENYQTKLPNYLAGFIQNHAFKENLVVFVFMSLAYGLDWVDSVEDYTDSQWSGQFVGDPMKEVKPTVFRSSKIQVDIDLNPSLNFAMQQNYVSIVNSLSIKNTSAEVFKDLTVEITSDPDFSEVWKGNIAELQPLQEVRLSSISLMISPSFLANLSEGISGHLRLCISTPQAALFDFALPVNLDAYNYWCGLSVEPKVLASFVFPRHLALPPILNRASAFLEKWTGKASFDEYQTRDPNRAKMQMAAVYETLAELNVMNSVSPVDYTKTGDKIRFPDEVLTSKMATELDMALLLASLLETIGLHVLIAFSEGVVMVNLNRLQPIELGVNSKGQNVLLTVNGTLHAKPLGQNALDADAQRNEIRNIAREVIIREMTPQIDSLGDLKFLMKAANDLNRTVCEEHLHGSSLHSTVVQHRDHRQRHVPDLLP